MQEIDVLIDDSPNLSIELIQNEIQNRLAHNELQSYNDTHRFLYKHPFAIRSKERSNQYDELLKLKRENTEGFLSEITNVTQNIRRIESQIKQQKYKDADTLVSWRQNLERAKTRYSLICLIINQ
jgi:hypothetical protein